MAKVKVTRKELKEDEIREFGVRMWDWAQENAQKLVIAAIVLVVLLLGYKVFQQRQAQNLQALNGRFYAALRVFEAALGESDADARTEKLATAREALGLFADQEDGPLAREAGFIEGNVLFFMEDYAQARDTFSAWLKGAATEQERARALVAMADCSVNAAFRAEEESAREGLLAKALTDYEAAYKVAPQSYMGHWALLKKAQLLERDPATRQAAAEIYHQLERERPASGSSFLTEVGGEDAASGDADLIERVQDMSNAYSLARLAKMYAKRLEDRFDQELVTVQPPAENGADEK
ncbi:hypothetical protein ACFL34_00710 [Candidatus Sumerlaeota bacterium]